MRAKVPRGKETEQKNRTLASVLPCGWTNISLWCSLQSKASPWEGWRSYRSLTTPPCRTTDVAHAKPGGSDPAHPLRSSWRKLLYNVLIKCLVTPPLALGPLSTLNVCAGLDGVNEAGAAVIADAQTQLRVGRGRQGFTAVHSQSLWQPNLLDPSWVGAWSKHRTHTPTLKNSFSDYNRSARTVLWSVSRALRLWDSLTDLLVILKW